MKAKEIIITTFITIIVMGLFAVNYVSNRFILHAENIYKVYLDGSIIGFIENDQELYNIINNKQQEIKEKYNVENVYPPEGFTIVNTNSYNVSLSSAEDIYQIIAKQSAFTIEGYEVKIYNSETSESKVINILDKNIFDESINDFILAFLSEKEYQDYMNGTQEEITTTGKTIELMYFDETITIKKGYVNVNNPIYTDSISLSQYLLHGDNAKKVTYIIKAGDTIDSVAYDHEMSTKDFLIINPNYKSADVLLTVGEIVNVTPLSPILTLTYEINEVSDTTIPYSKKTVYDSSKDAGYSEITVAGVQGLTRVTSEYIVKNGETQPGVITLATEIITQKVDQVTTKGYGYSGGGGTYVDNGEEWGFPIEPPCYFTSYYGYRSYVISGVRYSDFHRAIDISRGCGVNIYAAQDGVVTYVRKTTSSAGGPLSSTAGCYVIIKHASGYYTAYAHMINGSPKVEVGDTVSRGDVIGLMGMTGQASGCHVHFALWLGSPYASGSVSYNPISIWKQSYCKRL